PTLHRSGFTPRQLSPFEEQELLSHRLGITNFVDRASARADELGGDELRAGAEVLRDKVRKFRPRMVAFLGVTAYRTALASPPAPPCPRARRRVRRPAGRELRRGRGLGAAHPQRPQRPL